MTQLVCAFPDDEAAGRRLALALAAPFRLIAEHSFPDGESRLTAPHAAPDTILYRSLYGPDGKVMPLLLAADALRRAGASNLTLVAPYMPYMRQDRVFEAGQPVSRDVLGRVLGAAFDRIVTVQAHLHRTSNLAPVFRGAETTNLMAVDVFAALDRPRDCLVVSPDIESRPWAEALADRLGGEAVHLTKARLGDSAVEVSLTGPARVRGRAAVVFDDIVSTGGTACAAAHLLKEAGATSVTLFVVHALFNAEVGRRLAESGVDRILSSDSVPHPTNAVHLAGLLADALRVRQSRLPFGLDTGPA